MGEPRVLSKVATLKPTTLVTLFLVATSIVGSPSHPGESVTVLPTFQPEASPLPRTQPLVSMMELPVRHVLRRLKLKLAPLDAALELGLLMEPVTVLMESNTEPLL